MQIKFNIFLLCALLLLGIGCGSDEPVRPVPPIVTDDDDDGGNPDPDPLPVLSDIDLSNWKVTLPIGDPTEVEPPEILDYPNVTVLKDYMYDDPEDAGALVFYTTPGSTTQNSNYSRTELREQMVPGSNSTNWTFADGGYLKGELKVEEISGSTNNYNETIIMQIHGRLTDAQKSEIGAMSNNAPPVLKIYWKNGKVKVERKILADVNVDYPAILQDAAWDDETNFFDKVVDFNKFILEVNVTESKMEVILNEGEETMSFEDIHIEKWGVFENYFKAGNYLQSSSSSAFAKVKYYDLEVSH